MVLERASRSGPGAARITEDKLGLLSDLLSRGEIDQQGRDLARKFVNRVPKEKTEDAKRVTAEFELLVGDAVGYQRRANLGVLGKSRLVNSFQWALISEGYDQEFAKEIGGQLAVTLATTR
jgi:hypothetical protein